jgi:hypothetical protein
VSETLERELRAAFDAASDFVQPPPGLAEKVRRARCMRQRRHLAIVMACCALVVIAGGAYAGSMTGRPDLARRTAGPHLLLRVEYPVSQAAVSGPFLYLASNSSALAAVYDRRTGKVVRTVSVPGNPTWLTVGPGGLVWVDTADQGSLAGGLVLLSADLASRSMDTSIGGSPVLPTGRLAALTPDQYGLFEVQMPAPGQAGRASHHLEPGTSLGPPLNTAPLAWAGLVDGHVVAQVTDGYGYHIHLVIAGQPTRTFGGALDDEVGAVTSTGTAIWVQTFTIRNSYAAAFGPLVRLDGQLRVTTPSFVRRSPVLAKATGVWSAGNTIWVATGAVGHALVCFSASNQSARVITVQPVGAVATLTATADTAYVISTEGTTAGPSNVTSYPVPAGCR